jgi:glycosyltransferase involved in cell wall biosynthesis
VANIFRFTFLQTVSLTEVFGIAILEAACAGLHVVSAHVGGVFELFNSQLTTVFIYSAVWPISSNTVLVIYGLKSLLIAVARILRPASLHPLPIQP